MATTPLDLRYLLDLYNTNNMAPRRTTTKILDHRTTSRYQHHCVNDILQPYCDGSRCFDAL